MFRPPAELRKLRLELLPEYPQNERHELCYCWWPGNGNASAPCSGDFCLHDIPARKYQINDVISDVAGSLALSRIPDLTLEIYEVMLQGVSVPTCKLAVF